MPLTMPGGSRHDGENYLRSVRHRKDAETAYTLRPRCSCGRVAQADGTCWLSATECSLPKREGLRP